MATFFYIFGFFCLNNAFSKVFVDISNSYKYILNLHIFSSEELFSLKLLSQRQAPIQFTSCRAIVWYRKLHRIEINGLLLSFFGKY